RLARGPATGLASHGEAWRAIEAAVGRAWASIAEALRAGRTPTEVDVQRRIKGDLAGAGLTWKGGPIVAADAHAADPHYETGDGPGHDAPIRAGSVVMLDVWAKKKDDPDAIYADVTFMGFVGDAPPEKVQRVWGAVAAARDAGLAKAQAMWAAGDPRAFEVDRAARGVVEAAGFGPFFTHRTGHSLGQEDHWIGANIDDFETHDERRLIAGTGFTIEPGIYLPGEFGMRSEIDVFVAAKDGPVATTAIQRDLVKLRAR
ncbi:MAG TPA: M24 family metallopeptidase, partial [Planctomycetota bacterium]|nr:M24 family metallopeptidase [Planctomycetota bacterium]